MKKYSTISYTAMSWPPQPTEGAENEIKKCLASFQAFQSHITRNKNNLETVLAAENSTLGAIKYATQKLEGSIDTLVNKQLEIAGICKSDGDIKILETKVNEIIAPADEVIRTALNRSSSTNNVQTPTDAEPSSLKKVSFRPLDPENIKLWVKQVEDLLQSRKISTQLDKFITLTTLLTAEEASIIQDLTLAEPRPANVFDQAKQLIFKRYERPVHERISRAITMKGFEEAEVPSQWLARFRQTRGTFSLDDFDRWAVMRQMPVSLIPTLTAIPEKESMDSFLDQADKLYKMKDEPENFISHVSTSSKHISKSASNRQSSDSPICWFHRRFASKSHTCEGPWCRSYDTKLNLRQRRYQGNGKGELQ